MDLIIGRLMAIMLFQFMASSVLLFLDERERVRGRVVRKSGLGLRAVSTTKCTRSELGWLKLNWLGICFSVVISSFSFLCMQLISNN